MRTAIIEEKLFDGTVKKEEIPLPKPLGTYLLIEMDTDMSLLGLKSKDSAIALTAEIERKGIAGNIVGKIIDIGPAAFKAEKFKLLYGEDWDIKIGDKVIFKMSSGSSVPGSKGRYQFIDDQHLVGVYDE